MSVTRPELTLPEAEAALLREAYGGAQTILEYGSGGSTVMGAEMPGKTLTSVESDKAWAQMMRDWFVQSPPAAGSEVDIFWVDIGPTKEWGYPRDSRGFRRYADYPLEVWLGGDMPQPDVVLVDGRFRQGCAMATALYTAREVDLFVDDYIDRQNYHVIERWLGRPKTTGRMAYFRVGPLELDPRDLRRVIDMMTRA